MFISSNYICFASKEEDACHLIIPLREVSLTPSPALPSLARAPGQVPGLGSPSGFGDLSAEGTRLSPSLSTCPLPGPVGCGVPWMPTQGSASPGGKKGQALACQLRSHWFLVRAQGPSAGACPLGLPSRVFQLDFGISLLWLGLEDTDRAHLRHVTQRPPH